MRGGRIAKYHVIYCEVICDLIYLFKGDSISVFHGVPGVEGNETNLSEPVFIPDEFRLLPKGSLK